MFPPLHLRVDGRGPVLVLIHGVAGSGLIWQPVVAALAARYTVVRPDLLGYGRSPKPHLAYTPKVHVEAIRQALTDAGFRPPYRIAGLSMGALLTLEYAGSWPDEIVSMVGIGLPYYDDKRDARRHLDHDFWTRTALRGGIIGRLFITAAWIVGRHSRRFSRLFSRVYTPEMAQETAMTRYRAFRSSLEQCMIDTLAPGLLRAAASVPQAYLHGRDDRWCNLGTLRRGLAAHGNPELTVLDGVGHNCVILAPERTAVWMLGRIER